MLSEATEKGCDYGSKQDTRVVGLFDLLDIEGWRRQIREVYYTPVEIVYNNYSHLS